MKGNISAGAAIFIKLKALGVDYVFVNSGTDFPPIIKGLIEASEEGLELPKPIIVPHEHVAVSMAHGYYQMTKRIQAVILHTNVGLANGSIGAINAFCDQVPILLMSGRTPTTEKGRFGSRTVPIGWGQEMFDQAALVREVTKWDYELRFPEQISELIERAWAIANSTPKGPVYLSLPREVLCETAPLLGLSKPSDMQPALIGPTQDKLKEAARILSNAKNPIIISQRDVGSKEVFDALADFIEEWAMPLSHYWANTTSIPLNHPMHIGAEIEPFLMKADVVLVINSMAPWQPNNIALKSNARVIQLGPDPLFARTPIRNFKADINLTGETEYVLLALIQAMKHENKNDYAIQKRKKEILKTSQLVRNATIKNAKKGNLSPMTKEWVSLCVGDVMAGKKATVFHELGCPLMPLGVENYCSYFQEPHSGGLGWGFPAALGAQLADSNRLIFATMGDGSYMFSNPTVCHQVAEALGLPIIVLVLNNGQWGAVKNSVEDLYGDALRKSAENIPLTELVPSPNFTKTAQASRAYTEIVLDGKELPAALERAVKVSMKDRRQVLLDIAIAK